MKNNKNKQNKSQNKSKNNSKNKSNSNIILMACAIGLCVVVVMVYLIQRNNNINSKGSEVNVSSNSTTENVTTAAAKTNDIQVIEEGQNLLIEISDISSKASFYPIEVDGVKMEVIAVKDSKGEIRTAFNTCQVCYSSGRGYYVQQGNALVCQNCGNKFTMSQVGVESGGCNPWPILSEDRTTTDSEIEISYDYLKKSERIFSNWKNQF